MDKKALFFSIIGGSAAGGALLLVSLFRSRDGKGHLVDPVEGSTDVDLEVPIGPAMVVYVDEGSGAGVFDRTAQSSANLLNTRAVPATDGQELLDAVNRSPSGLHQVIHAGHGGPQTFLRPGTSGLRVGPDALRRWVSVGTYARALAPKLARSNVVISFAGCRSGAGPRELNWSSDSYGPGGADSLAGELRDEIVALVGDIPGGEIRAKSTTGTSFGNPVGRSFPLLRPQVGRPGIPLIDQVWGPSSSSNNQLVRAWNNTARGKPVMGWTIGGALPIVPRPS